MTEIDILKILIPVIVSASVVVLGWFVLNRLNWKKEIKQKRKDFRLKYLIEAYHSIRLIEDEGLNSYKSFLEFRKLTNNVYLFGTEEQVNEIAKIPKGTTRTISIDNINKLLVKEIREELELPFYPDKLGLSMSYDRRENDDMHINHETRFNVLLKSYKNLLLLASNGINNKSEFDRLYETLQDVWVFGSQYQSEMADLVVKNLKAEVKDNSLSKLISSIYEELRDKLDLPILKSPGMTLAYSE